MAKHYRKLQPNSISKRSFWLSQNQQLNRYLAHGDFPIEHMKTNLKIVNLHKPNHYQEKAAGVFSRQILTRKIQSKRRLKREQ